MFTLCGPVLPLASFLARMPQTMAPMGVLLLISTTQGSLGAAGLASAALAIGQAVGSALIGRLTDRHGQRAVVTTAALVNAALLVVLPLLAVHGAALWLCAVAALLAGLTIPPVGPLSRTRWIHLVRRHERPAAATSTAFSLEGALDELGFVVGPALVGLFGAAAGVEAALPFAAVLGGAAGTMFALHRTAPTGRVDHARPAGGIGRGERRRTVGPLLLALLAAMVLQGVIFSSVQTGTTALAGEAGHPGLAGALYATMGLTSALAGLGTAALPGRFDLPARLRATTAAMLVLSIPVVLLANSTGSLAGFLPLLGAAVGPYMITVFSLAERVVPAERLATAMGVLNSGVVAGYAVGSSLSGQLSDVHGATAAFGITTSAALAACLLALFTAGRYARRRDPVSVTGHAARTELDRA
ncbi:MFS transporter [Salinifilum ghardaiensis]